MTYENQFGRLERLLHLFSFRTRFSQLMLADLEDTLCADSIDSVATHRPVFVTGLPRSGTTILLELLVESGHFASHTYQDMPFVLCPLLWNRFSRHFATDGDARERAHGDGIQITSSSPEALEEILWKQFWPDHYQSDRIEPWRPSEANDEFAEFFRGHMAKIILIRQEDRETDLRYLSKNNVNIARLGAPLLPLHDGVFVIPFRDPIQHSASMLRQHRRFTELQTDDRFARRYMEEIGHHDFGLGLKPIDFDGWFENSGDPDRLDFWVRYWCAAYRTVLSQLNRTTYLISYDRLTENPSLGLRQLADAVDVADVDLLPFAERIRRPRSHEVRWEDVEPQTRSSADEIHRKLEKAREVQ